MDIPTPWQWNETMTPFQRTIFCAVIVQGITETQWRALPWYVREHVRRNLEPDIDMRLWREHYGADWPEWGKIRANYSVQR